MRPPIPTAIAVFILFVGVATLGSSAGQQLYQAPPPGRLQGTYRDHSGAVVPNAYLYIKGEGIARETFTRETGEYEIELPPGMYDLAASPRPQDIAAPPRPFCGGDRVNFSLRPSTTTVINLRAGGIAIDGLCQLGNEAFYPPPSAVSPFYILAQFKWDTRKKNGTVTEYPGSFCDYIHYRNVKASHQEVYVQPMLTFNTWAIYADTLTVDESTYRVEAEGNVLIEDGTQSRRAKRAVFDFKAADPLVSLDR
ncbi:MAG TPA: carboxypeptidase-like regulatory domain-containing protein [Blastocatellia bacterium]|nr:carboxypeptidase-like regulatory domain-containing protein [Blastocatellia bacterium]